MNSGTTSIVVGVALLILIKTLFRSKKDSCQNKEDYRTDHEELFKEDLDFDPTWSVLSSNTHHADDD